ncbi:TIGR03668 family PPOX class F420-dependent oxidoreductase [Saccharopolyspora gloriosae]|uniref:PPOX class probable F420-dependent enzyme n=1 Tax=Saccharopolyspora gloriosae TaxID=455344 RepID=A0A840NA79_9PSEU|nr:TIGR03668 family PPOX class F420-dependent oxidoreductase [Saccharopolyspora gloriosae]MBB5067035.1 PPOX class probable F420-dependent enzyme [Saccharopolyspora gloriosae]
MRISHEQARYWFSAARVARLATADPGARPHLVPVTFAVDGDVVVTAVDHKPKSTTSLRRLRNIEQNPQVTLLADEYSEDWEQLWWARADGIAELAPAASHPESVEVLAAKYEQYRQRPPHLTLIVVRVRRWSGWSASGDHSHD